MVEKYEEERRKTERRKYDIGYEKYNEERRKQDRRQEEKETNKWNYAIVLLILLCLSIFVFMISFGNWSNEEIVRGVKEVIL
ncbi:MAG: hypothetical protein LBL91_00545, partial [Lachnospiraceae bacterium]|nr:hypothetical protein [Lachnospiraceae bacterium]